MAKNQRARGHIKPGPKKGSATKNDNTRTVSGADQRVRILTSQASLAVGRPGFKGYVPGNVDGKSGVRRVMRNDPSVGVTQPGASKITGTNVDLVGTQNPTVYSAAGVQKAYSTGRKEIHTGQPVGAAKSPPVFTNKPGRVTRPKKR